MHNHCDRKVLYQANAGKHLTSNFVQQTNVCPFRLYVCLGAPSRMKLVVLSRLDRAKQPEMFSSWCSSLFCRMCVLATVFIKGCWVYDVYTGLGWYFSFYKMTIVQIVHGLVALTICLNLRAFASVSACADFLDLHQRVKGDLY